MEHYSLKKPVLSMLRRWFPQSNVTVQQATAGVSTPVFRVTLDRDVMYLRLGELPGERRDAEMHAHRLMRSWGIAVPDVLRWEAEPPELDRSAMLTSEIAGAPLAECPVDAQVTDALRHAGSDLAKINAIPVRGFGWISGFDETRQALAAEQAERSAWTREYVDAAAIVVQAGVLDSVTAEAVTRAVSTWAERPSTSTAWLAHGDTDATHIYVMTEDHGCSYTGIIDFGEARGADAAYDLGHALLHDGEAGRPPLMPALLDGYRAQGETSPPSDAAIWEQAIAIGTRALARQLDRPVTAYRSWLTFRLSLLVERD